MNGWIIYEREAAAYNRRYLSFYEEEAGPDYVQSLKRILSGEADHETGPSLSAGCSSNKS